MSLPKFDFIYHENDTENMLTPSNIDELDEYVHDVMFGEAVEFQTLVAGPPVFGISIPETFDEEGEPDEVNIGYFGSKEEALTAYREAMKKK